VGAHSRPYWASLAKYHSACPKEEEKQKKVNRMGLHIGIVGCGAQGGGYRLGLGLEGGCLHNMAELAD
jgi:hypothetical protein